MMAKTYTSTIISQIIRFVFILLFTYAAISKLMDFEVFRIGLSQAPLIEGKANWVAIGITAAALFIVGLLFFKNSSLWGLYGALAIMVLFTAYIAWALTFSPSLPCTCNGLLDLDWKEHLLFNICFLGLVVAGIILEKKERTVKLEQNRSSSYRDVL